MAFDVFDSETKPEVSEEASLNEFDEEDSYIVK